jgi:hypothetical protein
MLSEFSLCSLFFESSAAKSAVITFEVLLCDHYPYENFAAERAIYFKVKLLRGQSI